MISDLAGIQSKALKIVSDAGAFVREKLQSYQNQSFESKLDTSLVTEIDLATEQYLKERLLKLIPGVGLLAEETASSTESYDKPLWIIDPIDGTTNMVHGFPMFCISVALYVGERVVLGMIQEITRNEMFWAVDGVEGAFLNDLRIRVSPVPTLSQSILATGFPSGHFPHKEAFLKHFSDFMSTTHGIRRMGSAALDLAYVAAGACDGFYEYGLKPWDVAAGVYIVQKAGGVVTDFGGGNNYIFGGQILATNGHIHQELQQHFAQEANNKS